MNILYILIRIFIWSYSVYNILSQIPCTSVLLQEFQNAFLASQIVGVIPLTAGVLQAIVRGARVRRLLLETRHQYATLLNELEERSLLQVIFLVL